MNVASPEQKRRVNERLTERIRRLSIGSSLAKKRHKKNPKRILGEQLNEALKKGETREAHRLSRPQAGRWMGSRRRNFARILAVRYCSEEIAKNL